MKQNKEGKNAEAIIFIPILNNKLIMKMDKKRNSKM